MRRTVLLIVLVGVSVAYGVKRWVDWSRIALPEVQQSSRMPVWVDPAPDNTSHPGWNPFVVGPLPRVPSTPLLEEAAVYSAVIDRRFLNPFVEWGTSPFDLPPLQSLVFDAWTRKPEGWLEPVDLRQVFGWMREEEPALLEDSTFRSYLSANRTKQRLPTLFYATVPYELFEGPARHPPCAPFRKSHPRSTGIISFSRVGFNERHTEALLYAEEWCAANELGRGFWLVLKRSSGGGWKIVKTFPGFNAD